MPIFHRDSFPPGEAKRRLRELAPFIVPICFGNGRELRVLIIYKLFTPAIVLEIFSLHAKDSHSSSIIW
jgi:hypothetical protein